MSSTGTARYHLACEITEEGEQLEVVWLFRPKRFPQAEVENLSHTFESILTAAGEPSDTRPAAPTAALR